MSAPRLATVIDLAEHRPAAPDAPVLAVSAVGGGSTCRRGFIYRLAHSPAARDLRSNGWTVGLVLTALVLLAWSGR